MCFEDASGGFTSFCSVAASVCYCRSLAGGSGQIIDVLVWQETEKSEQVFETVRDVFEIC